MTEPLVEREKGRMIAALRGVRRTRCTGSWTRDDLGQRWTDGQIREALGLSEREFKRAVVAYDQTRPRRWTPEDLMGAVLRFALKEGRWPTSADMDAGDRKHGLPARSSISDHFRYTFQNQDSGFAQLVRRLVDTPRFFDQLTPQLIIGIRNVTVRRTAMEKYGRQKLIEDGGGELVQQDDEGKLWRMPSDNSVDDHMQFVELVNATPEPDGTRAHFFVRVPPSIKTAREAAAWHFNKTPEEYDVRVAT